MRQLNVGLPRTLPPKLRQADRARVNLTLRIRSPLERNKLRKCQLKQMKRRLVATQPQRIYWTDCSIRVCCLDMHFPRTSQTSTFSMSTNPHVSALLFNSRLRKDSLSPSVSTPLGRKFG